MIIVKFCPLILAVTLGSTLALTACGDPQGVCDSLSLTDDAERAADAAAREGFEVEMEVDSESAGTVECVWSPSESRLVGTSETE